MRKILFIVTLMAMVFVTGCKKPETLTYTVVFNANGGTGTMESQIFTEGQPQALTANAFTCTGLTFGGWNTASDGSGTAYIDGQTITVSSDMTLYAQWGNTVNGHEWVDLGLPSGTLWATCNLGVETRSIYGNHYAWGETAFQANYPYDWESYIYANGEENKLTKYCNNSSYGDNGFTDSFTVLLPEDDAATANWGGGWRMPTFEEFKELKDECTVIWTKQDRFYGCLFTGPNGNNLFLPAAGARFYGTSYQIGYECLYWSSSLNLNTPSEARYFDAYSSPVAGCYCDFFSNNRCMGFSVRPVCSASSK